MKNIDVLITHKNCPDGNACALVAKYYCEQHNMKEPEYMFLNYNDAFDISLVKDKDIIMADFSFDRDTLVKMHELAKSLVVLDHHKTAKDGLDGLDFCVFDMGRCGSAILWDYLFDGVEYPELIKYVCDRDLWKWELLESEEFSAGFQLYSQDDLLRITPAKSLLSGIYNDETNGDGTRNFVEECIGEGYSILRYQKKKTDNKVKQVKDNMEQYLFTIDRYDIPCINNNFLISETGHELAELSKTFSAQYFITDDSVVFSLRSVGDTDVSSIAKKYGGGGHQAAAGFSFAFDQIDLTKFLTTKNLDGSLINK